MAEAQRRSQLIRAWETLKFIAMDIVGAVPKSKYGKIFDIVAKGSYSKITRVIYIFKPPATHKNICFLDH